MPTILHLFTRAPGALARSTLERELGTGDRVTLVLLEGAGPPPDLDGVTVRRVPGELDYRQVLDLVFEADRVIAW